MSSYIEYNLGREFGQRNRNTNVMNETLSHCQVVTYLLWSGPVMMYL